MELGFTKMHGLGNDFIMVGCIESSLQDPAATAKKLCDRHFGIGADGLILVLPSKKADFKMRIFNPDGSEAEMCGNGIRCFAKYVRDRGLTDKKKLEVETLAGMIKPEILDSGMIKVDMGEPELERANIPMRGQAGKVISEKLMLDGNELEVTAVSMGNPHAIIFVEDLEEYPVADIGSQVEDNPIFPKKTNVEFVQVKSPEEIHIGVWERGAGVTLACGTGACASLVAGVLNKKTERKAKVHLPGGMLEIEWARNNHVYMTGPAKTVFEGTIKI